MKMDKHEWGLVTIGVGLTILAALLKYEPLGWMGLIAFLFGIGAC
jgi:hypothetical protein